MATNWGPSVSTNGIKCKNVFLLLLGTAVRMGWQWYAYQCMDRCHGWWLSWVIVNYAKTRGRFRKRYHITIRIESTKTTSMEDVSAGVLEKIKIKPKNDMMYQDIYNCICQNTKNEDILSRMSNLHPNWCLKSISKRWTNMQEASS